MTTQAKWRSQAFCGGGRGSPWPGTTVVLYRVAIADRRRHLTTRTLWLSLALVVAQDDSLAFVRQGALPNHKEAE
jgi:hypothetical protein